MQSVRIDGGAVDAVTGAVVMHDTRGADRTNTTHILALTKKVFGAVP